MPVSNLDLVDGNIVRKSDGRVLKTLGDLATEALYSLTDSQHITAETTAQIKSNAYSFGCSFAEVEVDIPMCKVKLLNMVNVHDCGTLINPALAEAQVHGGMSMAIGYGLSEELKFDEKTGKPLNNNLLDYKLSTFMDHPDAPGGVRGESGAHLSLRHQGAGRTAGLLRRTGHPQRDFPAPPAWPSTSAPSRPTSSTASSKRPG